ncbi:MAG: hypothetical protein WB489_18525 [Pseudolabrys sp.]
MSHIAPLPREAITDPEMIELIAQSEKLGIPDDLFPRIIARAPEQAKPLMRALLQSHARQCLKGDHSNFAGEVRQ